MQQHQARLSYTHGAFAHLAPPHLCLQLLLKLGKCIRASLARLGLQQQSWQQHSSSSSSSSRSSSQVSKEQHISSALTATGAAYLTTPPLTRGLFDMLLVPNVSLQDAVAAKTLVEMQKTLLTPSAFSCSMASAAAMYPANDEAT
jgi:hypothetical protein